MMNDEVHIYTYLIGPFTLKSNFSFLVNLYEKIHMLLSNLKGP